MAPLQEPRRSWPLRLEELWASPLDCQALGDWGAGVNRVSGGWTYVCHGPVGDTEEARHALGREIGKAKGLAGWGWGCPAPLPVLSGALGSNIPNLAEPSPSSLEEPPGLPALDLCSPLPDQRVFRGTLKKPLLGGPIHSKSVVGSEPDSGHKPNPLPTSGL